MDKRFTSARLAAKSKLQKAQKTLDAHIEVFDQAVNTAKGEAHVMMLAAAAIGVATGQSLRSDLDEMARRVALELSVQPQVLDAFVEFQIAMTEFAMATGKASINRRRG